MKAKKHVTMFAHQASICVGQRSTVALEHFSLVPPLSSSKGYGVMPGFAPAGEALLFRQKAPKPCWPWCGPSDSLRGSPTPAARKLAELGLRCVEGLKQCAPSLRCRLHSSATPPGQKIPNSSYRPIEIWSHQHLIDMTMSDSLRRLLNCIRRQLAGSVGGCSSCFAGLFEPFDLAQDRLRELARLSSGVRHPDSGQTGRQWFCLLFPKEK